MAVFRNLRLTGVLKNRFRTMNVVPFGAPTSSNAISRAPSRQSRVPVIASFVFVISSTLATAAMLESASPRNPMLFKHIRSATELILLVA